MATDRRLGSYFWLHEFPCWLHASESDIETLRRQVVRIADPTRREWGQLTPTSWKWWRDGCRPRSGAHADAGTFDFQATGRIRELGGNPYVSWDQAEERERAIREQAHREVGRWMATYLPSDYYGQIIDERNHIHVTRPGVGGREGQSPTGMALREPREGEYEYMFGEDPGLPGGAGTYTNPIWIEGVEAVVAGPGGSWPWWTPWALLLAFAGPFLFPDRG